MEEKEENDKKRTEIGKPGHQGFKAFAFTFISNYPTKKVKKEIFPMMAEENPIERKPFPAWKDMGSYH